MTLPLIIFDFDGVIADSEIIACNVLAQLVTDLGIPMSLDESLDRFMGKRIGDVTRIVESLTGRPLPGFVADLQRRTLAAFQNSLREVPGLTTFLQAHKANDRCIASSSAVPRIEYCLNLLKISHFFGSNVFSAEAVPRGKPCPDIFLYAVNKMDGDPENSLVIEDSPGGVEAAVAAGIQVVGLLAASHIRPGHEARLVAAGANFIASSYDDVSRFLRNFHSRHW